MKKLTLLFCIATCVSSMNYGMSEAFINEETNKDDFDMDATLNDIKKNEIPEETPSQKPVKIHPKYVGWFSFFMNIGIGAATKHYKLSNITRTAIFLASNATYALLQNKKYNQKDMKRSARSYHRLDMVYALSGFFTGNYSINPLKNFIMKHKNLGFLKK